MKPCICLSFTDPYYSRLQFLLLLIGLAILVIVALNFLFFSNFFRSYLCVIQWQEKGGVVFQRGLDFLRLDTWLLLIVWNSVMTDGIYIYIYIYLEEKEEYISIYIYIYVERDQGRNTIYIIRRNKDYTRESSNI